MADDLALMIRHRRGRREAARRQMPRQTQAKRQRRCVRPSLEEGQDIGARRRLQLVVGVLDPLGDRRQRDQIAQGVTHEIVRGLIRRDGREDSHI
ncbi:hypothetical protein D3C81_1717820 [compost metagenome]